MLGLLPLDRVCLEITLQNAGVIGGGDVNDTVARKCHNIAISD